MTKSRRYRRMSNLLKRTLNADRFRELASKYRRPVIERLDPRLLLAVDAVQDFSRRESSRINWFESFDHVARIAPLNLAIVDNSLPEGVVGPPVSSVGEWLVQLNDSASSSLNKLNDAEDFLNRSYANFTVIGGLGKEGALLVRGEGASKALIEYSLQQIGQVESFSLNQLIQGQATNSNDPELTGGFLVGIDRIDSRNAWDISRGSSTTVVGVVDTGIDATHPDLFLNIWLNQGELPPTYLDNVGPKLIDIDGDGLITFYDLNNLRVTPGGIVVHTTGFLATQAQLTTNTPFAAGPNASFVIDKPEANGLGNGRIEASDLLADPNWADGRDTDNNGFFDDFFGVNFRAGAGDPFASNNPSDELGHGTHVAGTIGATGNNATGVVGVNWRSSLMSLRILDNNNQGDTGAAIRAVNYASMMRDRLQTNTAGRVVAGADVRVLNNSWGQPGGYEASLEAAIRDLNDASILFVAAAGNGNVLGQGVDNDRTPFFPAGYDSPNVIAVAASDAADQLAAFSNFGRTSVDLLAPGVGIRSTLPGGAFGSANGTSMATPHVAGTAALIWSSLPEATVAEVKQAVLGSVDVLASAANIVSTGGRLNARNAINSNVFTTAARLVSKQDITTAGGTQTEFRIEYSHRSGIVAATIGTDDLTVTRQWGPRDVIPITVKPGSLDQSIAGKLFVTYVVNAPGGTWDAFDFGDYLISTVAGNVSANAVGKATEQREVGKFNVRIADPSILYVNRFDDALQPGTLRSAIATANAAAPSPRTIILESGNYVMGIPPVIDPTSTFPTPLPGSQSEYPSTHPGWSNNNTGDFDITGSVTIAGSLNDATIINGQSFDRLFKVHPGATLQLDRVTLTGGFAANSQGGAVLSVGTLRINDSNLRGNRALGSPSFALMGGGAMAGWDGSVNIQRSWLDQNEADFGGGIFVSGDTALTVSRSAVTDNRGGGVHSHSSTDGNLDNSTFSGNRGGSGAIFNSKLPNGQSDSPAMNADGRFIAFESEADNLVPGDTNAVRDIFVYDRVLNVTERVSVASNGAQANRFSFEPDISDDGRFVSFRSHADNLVPGDTNAARDIFVYDRQTRTVERVNVSSGGVQAVTGSRSEQPSLSADGRYVVYISDAGNLVPGDTNNQVDVFLFDRVTRLTDRVSVSSAGVQANQGSERPSVSLDGTKVLFQSSATNLVPSDVNAVSDFFVFNRTTRIISPMIPLATAIATTGGEFFQIAADGTFAVFNSPREDIGFAVPSGSSNIYAVSLVTGTIELLSTSAFGGASGGESRLLSLSANGRYVVFSSDATDLVTSGVNPNSNVYLYDRTNLTIQRLNTEGLVGFAAVSSNGTDVVFDTATTTNFIPNDPIPGRDVFLTNATTNTVTQLPTVAPARILGNHLTIVDTVETRRAVSGVMELSNSLLVNSIADTNAFVTGSNINQTFVGASNIGPLERRGSSPPIRPLLFGNPAINGAASSSATVDQLGTARVLPDAGAFEAVDASVSGKVFGDLNANGIQDANEPGLPFVTVNVVGPTSTSVPTANDGRFSARLLPPGLTTVSVMPPPQYDFFSTVIQSIPPNLGTNDAAVGSSDISRDGRYIVFASNASNLVPGDGNSKTDVFLYDTVAKTIECISVDPNGGQVIGDSNDPKISGDGRYIVYSSNANQLVPNDTNPPTVVDIFVYDRVLRRTELVTKSPIGASGNASSRRPQISDNGLVITYTSNADNLTPSDTNIREDAFVYYRNTRINVNASNVPFNASFDVDTVAVSGDGSFVFFATDDPSGGIVRYNTQSGASTTVVASSGSLLDPPAPSYDGKLLAFSTPNALVGSDTNGQRDIYLFDSDNSSLTRIAPTGVQPNNFSFAPHISDDGRFIAFNSDADNLVASDPNGNGDIFVFDRNTQQIQLVSVDRDGNPGISSGGGTGSSNPILSGNGKVIAFLSDADNLVPNDNNGFADLLLTANPLAPSSVTIDLRIGEVITDLSFPLVPRSGEIAGRMFDDNEIENGFFDQGEGVLSGRVVFLDANGNGTLDTGERSTVTGSDGKYRFVNVKPLLPTSVRAIAPTGFAQVTPTAQQNLEYQVVLPAGGIIEDRDFGFIQVSTTGQSSASAVSGRLYDDMNGNKIFDGGDVPMAGREVYLDASNFGVRDVDEPRTLTDANGMYSITGLSPRNVAVTTVLDPSLVQLSPIGSEFSLGKFPLYPSVAPFGNPQAIATGDFNQDGFQDVAVALGEANRLSIRLNNRQGGFTAEIIDVELGQNGTLPTSLVVGQFDADARLDVALTAQYSSKVIVLMNFNPTTKAFTSINSVTVGLLPSDIVAGQFAGDARPDLIVVNRGAGATPSSIQLLTNNGSGGFTAGAAIPSGGKGSISMVAGNFTGDAALDVTVIHSAPTSTSSTSGAVTVFRGNGAGALTLEPTSYQVGAFPIDSSAADFNGDGRLDVAVANFSSNSISILLGQANGTFRLQTAILGTASGAFDITVGDVDNDNDFDVIASNLRDRNVSIFRNDGINTTTNDVIFQPLENIGLGQFTVAQRMPLVVANFDNDTSGPGGTGTLDIVTIPQQTDTLHVLKNNLKNGARRVALTGLNQMTGVDFIIKSAVASPSFNPIANPSSIIEDAVEQSLQITGVTDGGSLGTTLQFTATSSNPAIVPNPTITFAGGTNPATLRYQPAANAFGTAVITVRAVNVGANQIFGDDGIFERSFTVTVVPVNDRPTAAFPLGRTVTVNEDAGAQSIAGFVNGLTVGGGTFEASQVLQPLTVTAANPSLFQVQPAINASGLLTFTAAANAAGSSIVTLTVKDNGGNADGGSDTLVEQFTIVLTAINDAPSISYLGNRSVQRGAAAQTVNGFAFNFQRGGGADEASQTIAGFSVVSDNAGLFAVAPAISPTGVLTFTPSATLTGTANVAVRVRDSGGTANGGVDLSAIQFFSITVVADATIKSSVDLGTLGANGLTIFGAGANDWSGYSVSGVGDVNNDGFDDVVIGARQADGTSNLKLDSGESYLVFGSATPPTSIDLAVPGTTFVPILGLDAGDRNGLAVSGAGDVNGDGFDDLLVGAPFAGALGNTKAFAGETYLILGRAVFPASIDLSVAGSASVTFFGADANDASGRALSAAGDVNGDGFDDLIIGADLADAANNLKADAGESYVVFGRTTFPATIDLASASAFAGLRIFGADAGDRSGASVSNAGDVNNDGFDDLLVGAFAADASGNLKTGAGDSYLIYGGAALPPTIDLANLGTFGVTIFGGDASDAAGQSVSGVGDLNGDGFDDILIGANAADAFNNTKSGAGDSYLVYGSPTLPSTINLASLGSLGIVLFGADINDASGYSVSRAGDVNADGFDDILIGAYTADALNNLKSNAGESFILLGGVALPSTIDLAIPSLNRLIIYGAEAGDVAGTSVSTAGDFNGDGFDDVLIGAWFADSVANGRADAGESYVVFGGNNFTLSATHLGTLNAEIINGAPNPNTIIAGRGNDIAVGNGGPDVLFGGQGNDTLAISDTNFRKVHGGTGLDTLRIDGANVVLNLTTLADNRILDIEQIDLTGSGNNTVVLGRRDVLNLSSSSNLVTIRGNAGDRVELEPGWSRQADVVIGAETFQFFLSPGSIAALRILNTVVVQTTLDAGSLNNFGITILGVDASDQSGYSISNAGDVNRDGYEDIIIGARFADGPANARSNGGDSYLVYGGPSMPSRIDLATLGTAGVVFQGIETGDFSGWSVSTAGDLNGDGFGDLVIGAMTAGALNNAKLAAGETYILLGSASYPSVIDLATLNSTTTVKLIPICGADGNDFSGGSVRSGGDINGDGYDDLVIGAEFGDGLNNTKTSAGESYVVFGAATLPASFNLAALGTSGVVLFGADADDRAGTSVSGAGDVNGDGYADFLVGAPNGDASGNTKANAGEVYLVYGKPTFTATIDLNSLGASGVTIFGADAGDQLGRSVSAAGDVNGDGLDDIILGAPGAGAAGNTKAAAGESFIIFGSTTLPATLNLASLGSSGLVLYGSDAGDAAGTSVASVGDVNGDGLDDIAIGAPNGDGRSNNPSNAGESYLVFGNATLPAAIDLSTFGTQATTRGFIVYGTDIDDLLGTSTGGGDFNGDGYDDLLIGAFQADGTGNLKANSGESFIVFGSNNFTFSTTHSGTANPETLTGTAAANIINGGRSNDILVGNGGADVFIGGHGNDILAISDLTFRRIDGGLGSDTLRLDGSGLTLNLTTLRNNRIQGIQTIDITGSGNNSLIFNYLDALALTGEQNVVTINRNNGDVVDRGTGWTQLADQTIAGITYQVFVQRGVALRIQAVTSAPSAPFAAEPEADEMLGATILASAELPESGDEFIADDFNQHQNPIDRHDVNGDGSISPIDVLMVINALRRTDSHTSTSRLINRPTDDTSSYIDVDGDRTLSPIDVLQVINRMNRRPAESESQAVTPSSNFDTLFADEAMVDTLIGTDNDPRKPRSAFRI